MRQILLICAFMLLGCQRLRLEVDDLKLRCGVDANLGDYEQWIEVATDYGKPSPGSIRAAMINEKLQVKNLPISSRGCVGKPKDLAGQRWLSIRVEEGGVFGQALVVEDPIPWRIQLKKIANGAPRVDCSKQEHVGGAETKDFYSFSISLPEEKDLESVYMDVKVRDGASSEDIKTGTLLADTDRNTALLNLQSLKEGNYQIELTVHDLLSFQAPVKSVSRKCKVVVDRTAPQMQLLGREGAPGNETFIKAAPGEAIEFKVNDQTNAQFFSCLAPRKNTARVDPCERFSETGRKITAPREGEWTLLVYAVDAAGNKSQTQEFSLAVFDSEKVRAISGWLEEAKLYIKQTDYLRSLYKLTQALQAFSLLKAEGEKNSIRTKFIVPLLQLLNKNVPFARFTTEGTNLDAVFPIGADRIVVVSGSIFNSSESEVKLMRVTGETLKTLRYDSGVSILHNMAEQRILLIFADGSYQKLNSDLNVVESGAGSTFPAGVVGRTPGQGYPISQVHVYSFGGATYVLNLKNADVSKLADENAGTWFNEAGEWVLVKTSSGFQAFKSKSKDMRPLAIDFPVVKGEFAERADFVCFMGQKELLCGTVSDLLEGKHYLRNELAGKSMALNRDGSKIAYASEEAIYLLDKKAGTHFRKAFRGPILQMFFDHENRMMVDTIIGRRSWDEIWDGFDASTGTSVLPVKKDQYWISGTDVFVKETDRTKEFHYLDQSGVARKFTLDADTALVSSMNLTLDRKFLVVRGRKDIQVYALNVQLSDGFAQPCNRISSDAEYCGLTAPGNFKVGRKVSDRGYQDYEMVDLKHPNPWREIVWNDQQPGTFAVWNDEEIGVGRFVGGKPKVEKTVAPPSNFLTVKWLAGRYLTWVDDNLKIFDVVKWDYVGDFSSVEAPTMFYPPVDFSAELSAFAAIIREQDGELVLKLLRAQDGAETGQWKFKAKGREEADVVRFSEDGRDLLLGFHDGTIQILESSAIRQGKLEPKVIGQHADSVMVGGFMRNQNTVFTLSLDGTVLFHDYKNGNNWLIQGEAVYPTEDAILYADAVKAANLVWVGDGNVLQIFDATNRSVDEVTGGRAYFRNSFVSMQKTSGSYYLIDTYGLNYLKKLCDWLEPSIRFGIFKSEESPSICL